MNQREEEILILEYFRKNYKDFPKGKVIKSESPDFIIKETRKSTIGIELTRLLSTQKNFYENLSLTIDSKEEKIRLYQKKNLNEIWLIVFTDFLKEPRSYNINNKMINRKLPFRFHKVFLFDLFENALYSLQ